ncbi:hypothetical protein [Gordonia alkanivorans]|uniref:hypothetical protein n=1 Tax=Gordonia alkanivorans TaxID=84096 RepID=UPI0012DCD53B|nr:hypothetical protein [Gordonia alkanivorans]
MARKPPPQLTPWRDPLPKPGPVFVFDIDGVIADMGRFEHLLTSGEPKWLAFSKHYRDAELIPSGARLVDDAVDAGFQIAYSTTRLDDASKATWLWLEQMDLPLGPIMTRHMVKDGSFRRAVDVKLRHWHWWLDRYGDTNPVAAWIDDDNVAKQALYAHGAPAYSPRAMQRLIVKSHGEPLLSTLLTKGHDHEELKRLHDSRYPVWRSNETAYQRQRSEWWEWTRQKAARAREERLRRSNARSKRR